MNIGTELLLRNVSLQASQKGSEIQGTIDKMIEEMSDETMDDRIIVTTEMIEMTEELETSLSTIRSRTTALKEGLGHLHSGLSMTLSRHSTGHKDQDFRLTWLHPNQYTTGSLAMSQLLVRGHMERSSKLSTSTQRTK